MQIGATEKAHSEQKIAQPGSEQARSHFPTMLTRVMQLKSGLGGFETRFSRSAAVLGV